MRAMIESTCSAPRSNSSGGTARPAEIALGDWVARDLLCGDCAGGSLPLRMPGTAL
jgi:hypothetical protein